MKVGIVVLSWNSRDFIGGCLSGLRRHEPTSPVYVVDNGSSDGSPETVARDHPEMTVIKLPSNLGFAGGSNVGIARALADGCDAVALLNNDTVIDEPFIDACARLLDEHPQIGIVGPVIVDAENPAVVQCRGGRIGLWMLDFAYQGAGERFERGDRYDTVDYVLGAAMIIRREALEATGGLDAEFFPAYVEEADLCFRAKRLGYRSVVYHGARVRHVGAKSAGSAATSFRRFTVNRFRFGLKHLSALQLLVATQAIVVRAMAHKLWHPAESSQ
jgi:GT2 family glycosyltransferase